ncbi:MAG: hypothetical protein Q8K58_07750 [Acidimicrobiales bacterium]|nr:hypothetical protein [Acidimicrobiales bacterium]
MPTTRRALLVLVGVLAAVVLTGTSCSDDDDGSAAELCEVLASGRSFGTLFEGGLDPTDTDRALEQLRVAQVDLQQLRDAAPSEARDDLEAELDYVDALVEVLERVDPDDPAAVVAEVNGLAAQRREVEAAARDLAAFEAERC